MEETLGELRARLEAEKVKEQNRKEIEDIGKERKMLKSQIRELRFRRFKPFISSVKNISVGSARFIGKTANVVGRGIAQGSKSLARFSRNLDANKKKRLDELRKSNIKPKMKRRRSQGRRSFMLQNVGGRLVIRDIRQSNKKKRLDNIARASTKPKSATKQVERRMGMGDFSLSRRIGLDRSLSSQI